MQPVHLRQVADVVEHVKRKLLEMRQLFAQSRAYIENPSDVGTSRLRT
jgi:hypothetical protein